jgi:predicted DNA-binding antitoxin AbrB/MazE fold protein
MDTFEAIFEGGIFRPVEPLSLPEHVRVQLKIVNGAPIDEEGDMLAIYEILSHRYNSGHTDTAARHNEHQP